jgi:toxin ParE1/3/4
MAYQLIIQDEAIYEIRDAFEWYEEQKPGLGYEFIREIELCYEKIFTYPEHYSFTKNLHRRIKTGRVPYIIIYEIEENTLFVNSVRHEKRKPSY